MNREQKAATIGALATELQAAETIIAVDYRGLTVGAAAQLRTKLRDADASFRIVKNSLTERAADRAGLDGLKAMLEGPTALTFVRGDAALAAKTIADQGRATSLLSFKGGVMGSEALAPEQVVALSRLPSREVLYGQLVGVVSSPIGGLVRTLGALIGGLAVALGQVQDQKEREGPATSAPEAEAAAEPPPEAEPPAEPAAAAEPTSEAEPPQEAEAAPRAEAAPEPEATSEPEPDAHAAPEPEATSEPEPDAHAAPEPEATSEPEPPSEATPEADSESETPSEHRDGQDENPEASSDQPRAVADTEVSETTKEH
jgi:large subunit ribosomal protein L10